MATISPLISANFVRRSPLRADLSDFPLGAALPPRSRHLLIVHIACVSRATCLSCLHHQTPAEWAPNLVQLDRWPWARTLFSQVYGWPMEMNFHRKRGNQSRDSFAKELKNSATTIGRPIERLDPASRPARPLVWPSSFRHRRRRQLPPPTAATLTRRRTLPAVGCLSWGSPAAEL